jgi:hypothetical protein
MGECFFGKGRVAAVAAADYEKHQQTQQWPSLTLLHTRTVKVTITKGRRRRRIKRESAAFLVAINRLLLLMPMLPNSFFSRLQLLFFFSRRCVHFFISFIPFLSFVRPNVGKRRRNDDINKTLSDAKNIIYMTTSTPKKDLRIS